MKKIKQQVFLSQAIILCLICSLSCQNRDNIYWQEKNATVYNEEKTLGSKEIIKFPIDNETAISYVNVIRKATIRDSDYLYFYNSHNNTVYIYNIANNSLVNKTQFPKMGENGVRPNRTNFVQMLDTNAFIIFDRIEGTYKFFNGKKLSKKIKITDFNSQLDYIAKGWQPSYIEPFQYIAPTIYISCAQGIGKRKLNKRTLHNVVAINSKTRRAYSLLPVPNLYMENNWGTGTAEKTHLFITQKNKSDLLMAFAADPHVYQYTDTIAAQKKFIGSQCFTRVKPMFDIQKEAPREASWEYAATTPEYYKILFDNSTGLFYRFTTLPIAINDYKQGTKLPGFSLIIADDGFNKLGEVIFSQNEGWNKYRPRYTFCSNSQIYLFRHDLYQEDGNHLYFESFTPQSIKL